MRVVPRVQIRRTSRILWIRVEELVGATRGRSATEVAGQDVDGWGVGTRGRGGRRKRAGCAAVGRERIPLQRGILTTEIDGGKAGRPCKGEEIARVGVEVRRDSEERSKGRGGPYLWSK